MDKILDIATLAEKYCETLYFVNADVVTEIFHPDAKLFCNTNDECGTMGLSEYLDIIKNRTSPSERGDRREEEIVSINVPSPTTAHLRVKEVFLPKLFTDELTLIKQDSKWLIVAKIWHFEIIPELHNHRDLRDKHE